MGLERMLIKGVYLCESIGLGKRWVVQANNVEEATGFVLTFCKEHLSRLDSIHPDRDVDVDLRFRLLDENVLEL